MPLKNNQKCFKHFRVEKLTKSEFSEFLVFDNFWCI
jgi:hypothetical protein